MLDWIRNTAFLWALGLAVVTISALSVVAGRYAAHALGLSDDSTMYAMLCCLFLALYGGGSFIDIWLGGGLSLTRILELRRNVFRINGRFQRNRLILCVALVLACFFSWRNLMPVPGQIDVVKCSPNGLFARLSASLYGGRFWLVQVSDIDIKLYESENWDQLHARRKAQLEATIRPIREANEFRMQEIYQKNPILAPSPAKVAADRLRARADDFDIIDAEMQMSALMQQRVPILRRCKETILGVPQE